MKEMAADWQQQAGNKSAQKALLQLVPIASKGKTGSKKRELKRKKKQMNHTTKTKKQKKKTTSVFEKALKQKQSHPLHGKAVKVIADDVPAMFQNALVIVHSVKSDGRVTVQAADHTFYVLPSLDCISTNISAKPSEPDNVKATPEMFWSQQQKQSIVTLLNGQVCRQMKSGTLLDDPELVVCMALEINRIGQNFLTNAEQRIRLWPPAQSTAAAVIVLEEGLAAQNAQAAVQELWDSLLTKPPSESKWMLACPAHSFHPEHWTMLLVVFEPNSTTISQVKYFDSLGSEPIDSRQKATAMLHVVQSAALQPTTDLPDRCNSIRQKDGWSCGYHSIAFTLQSVQALLNKKQKARSVQMLISQINSFQKSCQPAKTIPSKPPPLPPPAEPPSVAKAILDKPISLQETFGCSRCVYSNTRCLSCNPAKAMRYLDRKAAKEKLAKEQSLPDKSA